MSARDDLERTIRLHADAVASEWYDTSDGARHLTYWPHGEERTGGNATMTTFTASGAIRTVRGPRLILGARDAGKLPDVHHDVVRLARDVRQVRIGHVSAELPTPVDPERATPVLDALEGDWTIHAAAEGATEGTPCGLAVPPLTPCKPYPMLVNPRQYPDAHYCPECWILADVQAEDVAPQLASASTQIMELLETFAHVLDVETIPDGIAPDMIIYGPKGAPRPKGLPGVSRGQGYVRFIRSGAILRADSPERFIAPRERNKLAKVLEDIRRMGERLALAQAGAPDADVPAEDVTPHPETTFTVHDDAPESASPQRGDVVTDGRSIGTVMGCGGCPETGHGGPCTHRWVRWMGGRPDSIEDLRDVQLITVPGGHIHWPSVRSIQSISPVDVTHAIHRATCADCGERIQRPALCGEMPRENRRGWVADAELTDAYAENDRRDTGAPVHGFVADNLETSATRVINMDHLARLLTSGGLPAYVEQTGGGVATIYAGDIYMDQDGYTRHSLIVGPGWFNGPGFSAPHASLDEFYCGRDDDGETDALHLRDLADIESVATAILAWAAQNPATQGWREVARVASTVPGVWAQVLAENGASGGSFIQHVESIVSNSWPTDTLSAALAMLSSWVECEERRATHPLGDAHDAALLWLTQATCDELEGGDR